MKTHNLHINVKGTGALALQGKQHKIYKLVIKDKIIELISIFIYLGFIEIFFKRILINNLA